MAECEQICAKRICAGDPADEVVELMAGAGKRDAIGAEDRLDDLLGCLLQSERSVTRERAQIGFRMGKIRRREIEKGDRLAAHAGERRRRFA